MRMITRQIRVVEGPMDRLAAVFELTVDRFAGVGQKRRTENPRHSHDVFPAIDRAVCAREGRILAANS